MSIRRVDIYTCDRCKETYEHRQGKAMEMERPMILHNGSGSNRNDVWTFCEPCTELFENWKCNA